jgi:hypothetical protein
MTMNSGNTFNATWSPAPDATAPKLNVRKLALLGSGNKNLGSIQDESSSASARGSSRGGGSSTRRGSLNSASLLSYHERRSSLSCDGDGDSSSSSGNLSSSLASSLARSGPTDAESIIANRLANYGIVPLHRKVTVTECERCRARTVDDASQASLSSSKTIKTTADPNGAISLDDAVDRVHRWLFVEGGHYEDVQQLLENYSEFIRNQLQIPVDRIYFGSVGLHPKLTAYIWKWEHGQEFFFSEMPAEIFERRNEIFSPDEPFCILEQGRADFVRIKSTDTDIKPTDMSKWFLSEKYHDYYALPDIHRNQSKGAVAWASKSTEGFSDDHILFFERTMPALCTVMRVHTNDLVLNTLTERMEREIEERTLELAHANEDLAEANDQLEHNQTKQLEHFACMSHEIRTPLNWYVLAMNGNSRYDCLR